MMQIKLVDIKDSSPVRTAGQQMLAGVILTTGEDEWVASNGQGNWSSANGRSALPSSHVWLSDVIYRRGREWMAERNDMSVIPENWLRYTISDIAEEWGISGASKPDLARHVAILLRQILRIAQDAVAYMNTSQAGEPLDHMDLIRHPSLATGMRLLLDDRIRTIPRGVRYLDAAIDNLHQTNIIMTRRSVATFNLTIPRLSHARKLLARKLPAQEWKAAGIPEGTSTPDILDWARSMVGPVILNIGLPKVDVVKPALRPWLHHLNGTPRNWFTLEEVELLVETSPGLASLIQVNGAVASTGFDATSVFSGMLEDAQESCGGSFAAPYSWPLGVFANNCLAASMRKVKEQSDLLSIDGAWLAVAEKVETAKIALQLSEAGIDVHSYHMGKIHVRVLDDPESVMNIVDVAWRLGLVIPHRVAAIAAKNSIRPVGRPQDWGGDPADMKAAAIHALGMRDTVWRMAAIRDLEPDLRAQAFEQEYLRAFGRPMAKTS